MDVFEIVTDRIVKQLEEGTIPWHRPWCSVREGAFNRVSKKPYSLLNQMMLSHSGEYATLKQWTDLGGQLREGAQSEIVVFWKWPENEKDPKADMADDSEEKTDKEKKARPVLRYYRIYHISQVESVEPLPVTETLYEHEPIEAADMLFRSYIKKENIQLIEELSNRAYYSPNSDIIHIPDLKQYEFPEEYYSTALHEAVHSTGHPSRLNRLGYEKAAFGSEIYSKEELVAEIGSACILHRMGIETKSSLKNSAAYVQSWLKALKDDKQMIIGAASRADKAIALILNEEEPA